MFDPTVEISSKELHSRVQSGQSPLLLDVRNEQSFRAWNILDSKNFPIQRVLAGEVPNEFKDQEIVTICNSGNDSRHTALRLQQKGFNVRSLHGGLVEWNNVLDNTVIEVDSDVKIYQFRRIAKGCLSYIISVDDEAAIIDPAFKIEPYLSFIENQGLTVKYVLDTHLHADHISGTRILAEELDTQLFLPEKDPYVFDYTPIKANHSFKLNGTTAIRAIHTPGHTKGSTSFQIKDLGVLSGDTVFVDGIGRPDLANKAEEFASDLYSTITNFYVKLPRNSFIAPAHHGKFVMDHFNIPIITNSEEFKSRFGEGSHEIEFIRSALAKVEATPHPPSYETIIQINSGFLDLWGVDIARLEIGPNRCAIG